MTCFRECASVDWLSELLCQKVLQELYFDGSKKNQENYYYIKKIK